MDEGNAPVLRRVLLLRQAASTEQVINADTSVARGLLVAFAAVAGVAGGVVAYHMMPFAQRCVCGSQAAAHDDVAGAAGQGCQLRQETIDGVQPATGTQQAGKGIGLYAGAGNVQLSSKGKRGFLILLKGKQGRFLRQTLCEFLPFLCLPTVCLAQCGEGSDIELC